MGEKADLIAVQNKFGAFEDTHDLGAKVGLGEGDVVRCQNPRCCSDPLAEALALAMGTFDRSSSLIAPHPPPQLRDDTQITGKKERHREEARGSTPGGEGYGTAV